MSLPARGASSKAGRRRSGRETASFDPVVQIVGEKGFWREEVMRDFLVLSSFLVVVGALTSGCAYSSLKESNRRLKEANDHLIAENNRLERELEDARRGPLLAEADPVPASSTYENQSPSDKTDLLLEGLKDVDDVTVSTSPTGIHVRIPDRVFFALGQAKLSTRGQGILDRVARILNSEYGDHVIRVDGHTDDTPIRKVRHIYPTNWELSTARACTVVRYLVDRGNVSARRIYPAGFSYYHPAVPGRTASARKQNRRVELTILNERV
jgi:chemotaxis protein MotB